MANYKISQVAEEDIIRIFQYGVKQFGLDQAERCHDKIFTYFEDIVRTPYAYEAVDYIKIYYRCCPCGSNNIYYRIREDQVEIMTIVGHQDFG